MEIWQVLMWAIVTIILIIAEIGTVQLVAVWFAAGSLIAFISSLFGVDLAIQIVLFIIASIILLVATRPLAKKLLKNKKVATNADSIIGQKAVVTETIDNLHNTGRIHVNGLSWSARSKNDDRIFDVDNTCKVVKIEGVKAIVVPFEKE